MRAALQAQINKTDRNDARGIAQMMRAGFYRPVHVKTLRSQKLRMLLTRVGRQKHTLLNLTLLEHADPVNSNLTNSPGRLPIAS